ncbi:Complement C3 alpha chain [Armadillidium vulgare]|nr:Complement C3 alpha chain [Armadillidium vulgare]
MLQTKQRQPFVPKLLNSLIKRQLLFRHRDGSFSSFGDKDKEGSTWLTAFVVKSFAQARNYTLIDGKSLEESTNWLKRLQNTSGCFESKGRVINKMLQGGIGTGGGSQGLLTAYVLAALLEQGNVNEENKTAALKCVETDTSDHPYSLALKSYTLALAKSPNAKTVIDQLLGVAQSNASMLRWNLPDRKGQNTALHVETAAYALLGMVTFDYNSYKAEARKIVRWISSQRNGQGGFISTQDTVVALQALAAFEKAQPRQTLNMDIKVSSTELNHSFKVTDDNKFLQQLVDIPKVPASVEVSITGQGCGLVQGVLRYNVLSESTTEVLTLEVAAKEANGKDCKTQNITACASYTLQDGASNMAIMEFKLKYELIPCPATP